MATSERSSKVPADAVGLPELHNCMYKLGERGSSHEQSHDQITLSRDMPTQTHCIFVGDGATMLPPAVVEQQAKLGVSAEESKAERVKRQQARFRDRGGSVSVPFVRRVGH